MSSPDFYFSVNATFRHLHDRFGRDALVAYWRGLATEYYAARIERWRTGGLNEIARDWTDYFRHEPGAQVGVTAEAGSVRLDVSVCPVIKHLRDNGREIVPYFCDHCDHICGTMANNAGFAFERTGGMGSCRQRFVQLGRPAEGR